MIQEIDKFIVRKYNNIPDLINFFIVLDNEGNYGYVLICEEDMIIINSFCPEKLIILAKNFKVKKCLILKTFDDQVELEQEKKFFKLSKKHGINVMRSFHQNGKDTSDGAAVKYDHSHVFKLGKFKLTVISGGKEACFYKCFLLSLIDYGYDDILFVGDLITTGECSLRFRADSTILKDAISHLAKFTQLKKCRYFPDHDSFKGFGKVFLTEEKNFDSLSYIEKIKTKPSLEHTGLSLQDELDSNLYLNQFLNIDSINASNFNNSD